MAAVVARLRRPRLVTDHALSLRLFPSRLQRLGVAALVAAYLLLPLAAGDFWLSVLVFAGIFAIGALGLNLLTGYTGQVSLGHAFFMGVGAYACAHLGGQRGLPFVVWLPLAGLVGALVGGLVGPFALRLRGNYLAIVSLGLVFVGLHVWSNAESVTGGAAGVGDLPAAGLGPLNFGALQLGSRSFTKDQAYFWLVWALVALFALSAKNIVRSRAGRAMQAVRDREIAAAVIGVQLAWYKVGAFALSGALAAVAGALYGSYVSYVSPDEWSLFLSIQFIAVIIVGGMGTIFGSILGALFIAGIPRVIEELGDEVPLLADAGFSVAVLNRLVFGLVIVLFLVLEPGGLAGIWARTKAYVKAWPF